mgnify:CR=1 FL=1
MAWEDIGREITESKQGYALSPEKAWEWSLVLVARDVPHELEELDSGYRLLVPFSEKERGVRELQLYERENANDLKEELILSSRGSAEPTVWVFLLLGAFFSLNEMQVSAFGYYSVPWKELGSAHAEKILDGQWWRLITALTLHADPAHLLSNVLAGGCFMILLSRELGSGLAWLLAVLSGGIGNALNVYVQGVGHNSIGASTLVFGAVGILTGMGLLNYRDPSWIKKLVPVAAGLGMLSILGTGGENTDVGAHFSGFFVGLLLGFPAGLYNLRYGLPALKASLGMGAAACALVAAAWGMALEI